ncbi:MAG: nuclear transport factor 2 family protein [Pirellulaceae bacterium]|nr:nuclear transport factor 2 family protein [Pirellulaceae bacterium]
MRDQNNGSVAVVAIIVLAGLLLAVGGLFLWQRQRVMVAQVFAEQAKLEAERAYDMALQAAAQAGKKTDSAGQNFVIQPASSETAESIISKLLNDQQVAWNTGDIDQFMIPYWKSEQLTFSSGGKTKRGWQATLDNYKTKYPTKHEMGQLTFDHLEFNPLGDQVVLVLGQWHLQRDAGDIGGNFTLVWQRIDNQWRIIHDHSSALE